MGIGAAERCNCGNRWRGTAAWRRWGGVGFTDFLWSTVLFSSGIHHAKSDARLRSVFTVARDVERGRYFVDRFNDRRRRHGEFDRGEGGIAQSSFTATLDVVGPGATNALSGAVWGERDMSEQLHIPVHVQQRSCTAYARRRGLHA